MNARVPDYAVIIPHYNDVQRLIRCLEALEAQQAELADPDAVEIIVADNASSVSLDVIKQRFPEIRVVNQPEQGAGLARNAGVAASQAAGLMFIDSDCVPSPGWLARGCLIGGDDVLIGGPVTVFDETPPPRTGAEAFEAVFAFHMKDYVERHKFMGSGNMVTTRAVFDAVGPFRTGMSEDVDWSRRAVAAGFEMIFDDHFSVGHPSRQDWPALRRKWTRITEEMFGLRSERIARLKWGLRGLAMPLSAIAHTPKILTHSDLTPPEKLRATGTLFKLRLLRCYWMLRQSLTGNKGVS